MVNRRELRFNAETWEPTVTAKSFVRGRESIGKSAQALKVVCCLAGKTKVKKDGVETELRKGDILLINPGTQCLLQKGSSFCLQIEFDNVQVEGEAKNCLPLRLSLLSPVHYQREIRSCTASLGKMMELESEESELMADLLCRELLLWIVMELLTETGPKEREDFHPVSYDRETLAQELKTYFERNYMYHISMADLAGSSYLSAAYLTRVFRETFGTTPIDYLIGVRLKHAGRLLSEEKVSVQDAAKAVGYEDPYYFSKIFTKKVGVNPSEYRAERDRKKAETAIGRT